MGYFINTHCHHAYDECQRCWPTWLGFFRGECELIRTKMKTSTAASMFNMESTCGVYLNHWHRYPEITYIYIYAFAWTWISQLNLDSFSVRTYPNGYFASHVLCPKTDYENFSLSGTNQQCWAVCFCVDNVLVSFQLLSKASKTPSTRGWSVGNCTMYKQKLYRIIPQIWILGRGVICFFRPTSQCIAGMW